MESVARVAPPLAKVPYLVRALRSTAFGLPIGIVIALLRGQSMFYTLIYSLSIALLCWFFIDLGRRLVSRHLRIVSGTALHGGWPRWPWMLGVVIAGSVLGFVGGSVIGDFASGAHSIDLPGAHNWRDLISQLLFVLLPAIAITYFFYSRGVLAEREAAVQVAQRQAAESRLRLLEAQLEPHMFFNTLANLHVLIGVDPPRAQAMLDKLIAFLRATLSGSRATEQPLSVEFERIRDYLALMQVRMEQRLRIRLELPAELAQIPVPPLLLQPLVENCIKHGLEPAVAGGLIEVCASREGAMLVVRVRDTGIGIEQSSRTDTPGGAGGTKFGLAQVRERLSTLYGAAASLTLQAVSDMHGGTLATVRLPLH